MLLVPDEFRGRVNSVFRFVSFGPEPLSLALTGLLLQAYGGMSTILMVFVPQVLLAALTTLNSRLRRATPARG